MSESSPHYVFPPVGPSVGAPHFAITIWPDLLPEPLGFMIILHVMKFQWQRVPPNSVQNPSCSVLGACTTSGADSEPVEGDHTDGAPEVTMTIYGGWRYVKHNEQNINMCDKVTR